jgi:raffinose/stachyose/melibiose transport system substrate-binding protein
MTQDPNCRGQGESGDTTDARGVDELFERGLTRAGALRGLGGVLAAGAVGGLVGATPAFARSTARARSQATTISMWGNHPEWKPVLDRLIADFEKTNPNINVELSYKPGPQYTAALNTALAGGAAPDVIGWIEGDAIRVGAKAKQIDPLDGKIPIGKQIPAARAQVVFNGHAWGSPLAAYTVGIFYQRPIFKKYGLTPPTNWPQLLAVTKKLKAEGVTPWSMPAKDMIIPYFFYIMAASAILGQDGYTGLRRGTRKVTEPQVVRAAQLMIDLQEYYNEGFQAVSYAEGKALFAQGRTAMLIGGSADYTGYKQVNPKVDVGVFGFPSPSGNRHVTTTGMELLYTVNAKSSHKPEATTLVAWLSSRAAQQVVADELARPIAVGVVPSAGNRVGREMVLAGKPDIPVWYSQPETGGTFGAVTSAGGIFTGDLDAAGFAKKVQASIKPNPKA